MRRDICYSIVLVGHIHTMMVCSLTTSIFAFAFVLLESPTMPIMTLCARELIYESLSCILAAFWRIGGIILLCEVFVKLSSTASDLALYYALK